MESSLLPRLHWCKPQGSWLWKVHVLPRKVWNAQFPLVLYAVFHGKVHSSWTGGPMNLQTASCNAEFGWGFPVRWRRKVQQPFCVKGFPSSWSLLLRTHSNNSLFPLFPQKEKKNPTIVFLFLLFLCLLSNCNLLKIFQALQLPPSTYNWTKCYLPWWEFKPLSTI